MGDREELPVIAVAAQNVVNVLRSLADEQNKAILMTLHQPRSSIMRKFESVMVLAEGEMIYNGAREEFPTYMDGTLQCTVPLHENPYDVMLDVLNPAISKDESVPALGRLGNDFDGNVAFWGFGSFDFVYMGSLG